MLNFIIGIVPFLIIISLIVTFHEFGHYSVARLFGTRIERFSVGFGKILLRRKDKRGTEWCISALPLGGYVKFAGDENVTSMMPSAEELEASREAITQREGTAAVSEYFHFKPLWQRFLVVLAGPVANFILAIAIFTFIFATGGERVIPSKVSQVEAGSPAAVAGFQAGDIIRFIDGKSVNSETEARMLIMLRGATATRFVVERAGANVELTATPRRVSVDPKGPNPELKVGQLGIIMGEPAVRVRYNPIEALVRGNNETWRALDTNLTYIARIFTGKENGNQIGGIVGMTKTTGDVTVALTQYEAPVHIKVLNLLYTYLQYMAYISIAVGFLNLLPIPALDGGHLAFFLWQGVTRKPISPEIQSAAFRIAVVLVLGLMTFAFWNDINNHGLTKFIGGLFS
ncbi:RIP metalloprotease RseP [Asticcacaulis biprosthecium C19]|uniref:RIP metalloprotease RseP n=1 Tax=Asticcacaulis biprosthecium C19 TaxID=715226 RepID=F4QQM2_9CAUL|nr:RIP metalloprotease [Asticcacaulis biprosthecium]EGF90509.1 RIP metalloprotease RseP [Asticcacaulis biprosthecium C19]